MSRALITGVTGQDGSYLAELLLVKGYEVFGVTRRASTENVERIAHLIDRITLLQGDLLDRSVPARTYNVSSGETVTMQQVVELLVGLARVPVRVERDESRVRPVEIPRLAGDPSRLRAATGWRPEIPLERTLADTLAAAREMEPVT